MGFWREGVKEDGKAYSSLIQICTTPRDDFSCVHVVSLLPSKYMYCYSCAVIVVLLECLVPRIMSISRGYYYFENTIGALN